MSEASLMCTPTTCADSASTTSSPASEDGPLQLGLLGGQTTASCGPAPRRASRSASRAKAKPRATIGTCGPTIFGSSVPDGPLSAWESRLRRRLARTGSTECLFTWKASDTPGGRPLSRLVPSTRPIDGIGSGLWPTPLASDGGKLDARLPAIDKRLAAGRQIGLAMAARLETAQALWPTPTASRADKAIRTPEGARTEVERGKSPDLNAQAVAMWPTPCARDHMPAHTAEYVAAKKAQGHGMSVLPDYVSLAATGITPGGSSVTTEKPGALNPRFVCWLMGFPAEWDACAPTAMPSSRKSRQR